MANATLRYRQVLQWSGDALSLSKGRTAQNKSCPLYTYLMKLESSVSKYQQPYSGYWLGEIQEPQPSPRQQGGGLWLYLI